MKVDGSDDFSFSNQGDFQVPCYCLHFLEKIAKSFGEDTGDEWGC